MKVWLTSVAVLFVLVQLFQSIKGFFVPLPIYILAGAFLAIASNYDKGIIPKFKTDDPVDQSTDAKS
ncbi:hypothetical protein [[Limnothrix rosea] IAM M-220]|uniref:hypothetical protein n=1 Tax=[Limnothrix rosea] IAM M-220 TaxID=454133 RepID=UPI00096637B6|nr:hypothetical protein [[Limnothrix rosea] IAM M-220]OKH17223.1 hypothetical protein NIES208_10470 [[Limnothrix rosea] IAM M-220]